MHDWDDLRFVLAVHRGGSLAAAARTLRVDATTVGRRIDQAEDRLGVPLFVRQRGDWRTTVAGERVVEAAARAEQAVAEAVEGARATTEIPRGRVHLTTIEEIATWMIAPLMPSFHERYPEVELVVSSSIRVLNLGRGEADLAIRVGRPSEPDLTARRLGAFREEAWAARSWVEARGVDPGEITRLDGDPICVMSATGHRAMLQEAGGGPVAFRTTSTGPLLEAVARGLGVGMLASRLVRHDERLVRLDGLGLRRERDLWLLFPPEVARRAAVRVVIDHLIEALQRA